MIEFRQVTKVYETSNQAAVTAVREVNLTVARGEFLVITGRSGSGKTTLLNLAAGLTSPTSGEVLLEGTNLRSLPDRQCSQWRNRKIGFVFQFPSLLPSLDVLENVMLPTVFGREVGNHVYQRAGELLETVGLPDKLASLPRQLSAGQQQRVVIARALINHPEILLADEPTSDLDEQTETEIMSLLKEIHDTQQITVMMVTHTRQLVSYGTRSIEMAGGSIVAGGTR